MSYNPNQEVVSGGIGAGSATRDMKHLRKKPKVTELIKEGKGNITDLSGNHSVELDWELNDVAVKDKIFKITVDEKEIYIDFEELMFYTRVMFMKG